MVRILLLLAVMMVMTEARPMYQVYMPRVEHRPTGKGIGMAYPAIQDVDTLRCEWFYNWGSDHYMDTRYVPMSFAGEDPGLPADYAGYLLVFNEPENPNQANLMPEVAAVLYGELRQAYPRARIILGGMGVGAQWYGWFDRFDALITVQPDGWHLHGYVESGWEPWMLDRWWGQFLGRGEVWITEFGDPQGRVEVMRDLVQRASKYDRFAWFANRVSGEESWYPGDWPRPAQMGLVEDGELTALGEEYR